MAGEVLNLENNSNCLFCKVPPTPSSPVTLYPVQTLLDYLQMTQIEMEIKTEGEEQQVQDITVDLKGEVNAGLCKGCGDLVKRFLKLKEMMEMSMEVCLVSIQMKMKVGSERNDGMEYPIREGRIVKEALQRLKMTQPCICSKNLLVSEASSTPANDEPKEVVKIEEKEEDEVENDSDSVPIISEIANNKIESCVPTDEYHDKKGEADEKNKRWRKMLPKLSKARGQMRQKRVIGVGQRRNARQVSKAKAPAYDKRMIRREENGEDGMNTTTQTSDSAPVISGIVKTHCPSSTVTPRKRRYTRVMKFQCSQCENKFSNKSHLELHLAIHNGERPWVCRICKKTFQRKGNLRLHRLLHSKPVTCDACQKQFRNHADLRMHEKLHFPCTVGKGLSSKANLKYIWNLKYI